MRDWHKRLAHHPQTDLGVAASELLAEGRAERDSELA